jgi:eukaryotic-like serine/threonine-protein kinase
VGPPMTEDAADLAPGTMLDGDLCVEARIGAGASSVVYRVHDGQLDRKLAIKLQITRTNPTTLARLEREAQAMARLTHPNVCTVHGVGSHDGRAYIVMELVDGGTARQWLHTAPRSWREIVTLYLQAARGLAAAHAAGLVHGDFKPDNVLTGALGGDGGRDFRARVTDFGSVRVIGESHGDGSTPPGRQDAHDTGTSEGGRGTHGYAAPELSEVGAVAPAADQYSLCVALHEAVLGHLPDRPPAVGDTRAIAPPAWLRRTLARGQARDPAARWPSMAALADRLELGLAGGSRARMLIAIGGAAILAAALGAFAAVLLRPPPCEDAAARIASIWAPTRLAAIGDAMVATAGPRGEQSWARASAIGERWVTRWIDARDASCRATRVDATQGDELLERSMGCFDRRAAELDATLDVLGQGDAAAVHHAVEALDALRTPDRCNDPRYLLDQARAPEDPSTAAAVEQLRTRLRRVDKLLLLERIAAAKDASAGLEAEADATGFAPVQAEAALTLGGLALQDDRVPEAIAALTRAHLGARELGDGALAADAARLLAKIEVTHGEQTMARDWIEIARIEVDRGVADPELGVQLARTEAFLLRRQSKYDEALAEYRHALELAIAAAGEHLLAATVRDDIAGTLFTAGRATEAEAAFLEAIAAFDRELGPGSPQTAGAHASMGLVMLGLGRREQAIAEERISLAMSIELYGADSPRLVDATLYLVNALASGGELVEARREGERALALALAAGVPDSADVAVALEMLGWCAFVGADYPAALDYMRRAQPLLLARLGDAAVEVAQNHTMIAHAAYELGRVAEARDELLLAVAAYARGGNALHSQSADTWTLLSRTQIALGELAAARTSASQVIAISEQGTVEPTILAAARCCLARAMLGTGGDARAARELARIGSAGLREAGQNGTADECDRWAAGR